MTDTPRSTSPGFRAMPALVLVVFVIAALTAFVVTRRVVSDQEGRLLAERADEAAALLSSTVRSSESSLRVLGGIAATGDAAAVTAMADAIEPLTAGGTQAVGIARRTTNGFGVVVGAGDGPSTGDAVNGERAQLLQRASATNDLVADLVHDAGATRLAFALAVGDVVAYQDSRIDPGTPLPSNANSPFRELRGVVYAATEPDPSRVVLTTEADVPLSGRVVRQPLSVGEQNWLLVVGSRSPLVGSFAKAAPWLLFAGGLVAALLAAGIAEVLARRRSYALALVAERTSELRAAQEAAESANRAKSEFLSRMSHELRTPLNAVLGFGQLLELDDLTDEQHDAVAHIMKGGSHLLELINEVLDITRVETGNMALSPEPVLAGDVLSDAIDLVRPLADQRGIHIVADRSGGWDDHVFADRQRAKQVILNLLSNAVKYNRQRGTVAASCQRSNGGRVRLTVTDTGPGMRPDQLSRLFTPFERLGAEASDIEGTGIGLALSQRLAEAMGGTLGVTSTPGQGSTFWLDLPHVEAPLERYERLNGAADHDVASTTSEHRDVVLHIEDNLSNVTLVERILAHRGNVEVIPAMHGGLGLELAHEHRPVLILLDLHLPDLNGEAVLQRLRDDPVTASTPVVIVSADATPGQVQRLLAAGASAYLTKPIVVPELLQILDDILANKR